MTRGTRDMGQGTRLALAVLALAAVSSAAALVTRHTWAALSSAGDSPSPISLQFRLPDNSSGTAEVIVTGSPATCKAALLGRLEGGAWDVIGVTDDCTGANDCYPAGEECNKFHWTGKTVDELNFRLIELTGGSTPTAAMKIKVVGQ